MTTSEADRISVLMPTIRFDQWFEDAVASVLAHDPTPVPLELVVICDGVTPDRTRPWASDPRVRLIELPTRMGVVRALDAALQATDSRLVARLDADDLTVPSRFATQAEFLATHPDVVLVASAATRIDPDGAELGPYPTEPSADARPGMLRRNLVVHSSVMFRRSDYDAAGGFNTGLVQMEDYDLWLRMGRSGAIAILDDALVKYRVHPAQVNRGARPWGPYIRNVAAARRSLGRALGVNALRVAVHGALWRTAQALRWSGLRRPGYDRD